MKPINTSECKVPQLGVDLKIDDGQIISPVGSPTTIEVSTNVVTLGGSSGAVRLDGIPGAHLKPSASAPSAAAVSNAATTAMSGPGGNKQPSPRLMDDDWRDLFWVPHTRLNYLDRPVDPNWRTNAVTGYMTLAGGRITAGTPSDGASVNGLWEFRTKTPGSRPTYQQAITDRLRYFTDVSGTNVTITLTDAATGVVKQQIVVAPVDNRKTVGLILAGRHSAQMPIEIGDPLEHFCTFYQMMQKEYRPGVNDQLIPYFIGDGSTPNSTLGTGAQPTPGLYCPGDWP